MIPGEAGGYIDTPDGVKNTIDEMVRAMEDNGDDTSWEFKPVQLTEVNFNSLPEFKGF